MFVYAAKETRGNATYLHRNKKNLKTIYLLKPGVFVCSILYYLHKYSIIHYKVGVYIVLRS